MSRFLQLHYLTIYPLSNPNRDDLGRPKTANYGGAPRLRISSQSLKRAARLSDTMQAELKGHLGKRTQRIGEVVRDAVARDCESEQQATEVATKVADIFGKLDSKAAKKGKIRTRQLAFISPDERATAIELARKALAGESLPKGKGKHLVWGWTGGAVGDQSVSRGGAARPGAVLAGGSPVGGMLGLPRQCRPAHRAMGRVT